MYPSMEELQALAGTKKYRRLPLCRELYSDRFTPIEVMRILRAASKHCFLLESAEDKSQWGRYSFLGYEPKLELSCARARLRLRYDPESEDCREEVLQVAHPGEKIREILAAYKSPALPQLPPFTGGLVGYFSFEYLQYAEPELRESAPQGEEFQDVDLMLFDKVICFDNFRQKLILITGVDPDNLAESYQAAQAEFDRMQQLLLSGARAVFRPLKLLTPLALRFSRERYCAMVEQARHYIHEGDIFQVVLSNPMEAKAQGSLFDLYRVLRTTNPSPYMFYFTSDSIEISGASPETLVKKTGDTLRTFPLAGTRPRGQSDAEDLALEKELLADEKELAEHNMLVDLGRNDLGKVSALGTVRVEQYQTIQRYSHVMHIGSTVAGTIRADKDALDAVDAILPAGTLSGAPKLRAVEIIGELEGRPRGVYGGALGYLSFTGDLDICIAIRLCYKKDGRICVQSGAGIVADSVPEKEYDECRNKARAVVAAIETAEGGIL